MLQRYGRSKLTSLPVLQPTSTSTSKLSYRMQACVRKKVCCIVGRNALFFSRYISVFQFPVDLFCFCFLLAVKVVFFPALFSFFCLQTLCADGQHKSVRWIFPKNWFGVFVRAIFALWTMACRPYCSHQIVSEVLVLVLGQFKCAKS